MSKDAAPRPIYCWDTTVFLAWLNEEKGAPLPDIDLVAREIDSKAATLIVPVTIASEILRSKLTAEQRKKLTMLLKRSNIVQATITLDIAEKAGEIRDSGAAMKPKRKIKTPDATIIAAAIIYGCSVLHSLDDGILSLDASTIVDGLRITKPRPFSGQRGLENFV